MFNEFWKYIAFIIIVVIIAIAVSSCQNLKSKSVIDEFDSTGSIVIKRTTTEVERDGSISWSEGVNKTLLDLSFLNLNTK